MADRIYTFNANQTSVSGTAIWRKRWDFHSDTGEGVMISSTAGQAYMSFTISGLTLNGNEHIKKVILYTSYTDAGDHVDMRSSIHLRSQNYTRGYATAARIDLSSFSNGNTYQFDITFASNGGGEPSQGTPIGGNAQYAAYEFSLTRTFTNMRLEITVGAGADFSGELSSLSEGTKIRITDVNNIQRTFTLVHHYYNTAAAHGSDLGLLLCDDSIGTSQFHYPAPSSEYQNSYTASSCKLNTYLTNWYNALPSSTKQFLHTTKYSVRQHANSSSANIIERDACTLSLRETGLGGSAQEGQPIDYIGSLPYSGGSWWSREVAGGMDRYAYQISSNAESYSTQIATLTRDVRPTIGMPENTLLYRQSPSDPYYSVTKCGAPNDVCICLSGEDVLQRTLANLNKNNMCELWWATGNNGINMPIQSYKIYYSTVLNGQYQFLTQVPKNGNGWQSTQVPAPDDYNTTWYYKVAACGYDDAPYCDSDLSSNSAAATTKTTNIKIYTRTADDNNLKWSWAIAQVYVNGDWKYIPKAKLKLRKSDTWKT